jgi:uncharacterized protein DUF4190/uncharacterized protein DUF2510
MDPAPTTPVTFPAAWYPDPQQCWPHRYWDGTAWTRWVSDGVRQFSEPVGVPVTSSGTDDTVVHWLLPVGRSGWAIAAGYAGLFAFLIFPAPIALGLGVTALFDLHRHPELGGRGRAIFGTVIGALGTALLLFALLSG